MTMTMTNASLEDRAQTGGVVENPVDPGARATRRSFTAEYKANILAEYDACTKGSDERGALLRREGLYSSHISEWRRQAETGARQGLAAKSKKRRTAAELQVEKLTKRNEQLETELKKTKLALEITGKAHALLEMLSESADSDPTSKP